MVEYAKVEENKYVSIYPSEKEKSIEILDGFIRASGGDGTLLDAIRMFKNLNLPFYGVAAGTKNFMMNPKSEFPTKNSESVELAMIDILLVDEDNNEKFVGSAFNEVYIGELCGWTDFECEDSDDLMGKFTGAGVVISTAQGSTGLNKNNSGSILQITSSSWSITSVQTDRKLKYVLKPEEIKINYNSRDKETKILLDGKVVHSSKKEKAIIRRGRTVKVIFNDLQAFKEKRQYA